MALMQKSLAAAERDGHRLVILVGDEPYYGQLGFRRVAPGRITLPGPVDPDRLLVKELVEGAFDGVRGAAKGG
jgi:predicted N-acetyltransferase YhbS